MSAQPTLSTIAIRAHHLEAMVSFYSEAFGVEFRLVETSGLHSQFGKVGSVTLKLVPIRAVDDFDDYPIHQLGFEVPDIHAVIKIAEQHGGRAEGEVQTDVNRLRAAVRDPDGNTIELYAAPSASKE